MKNMKFRAWDKKHKEWYRSENDAALTYYGFSLFGECMLIEPVLVSDLPNLIVTQFTGLQDSKGKDIYEGDILKLVATENNHHQKGATSIMEVKIFMGNSCVCFKDNETGTAIYPHFLLHEKEVIGNIYQNPELMGK